MSQKASYYRPPAPRVETAEGLIDYLNRIYDDEAPDFATAHPRQLLDDLIPRIRLDAAHNRVTLK
jgi:hypothetical protein